MLMVKLVTTQPELEVHLLMAADQLHSAKSTVISFENEIIKEKLTLSNFNISLSKL